MFLQLNRRSELPTPIRQRVLRDANGRISRVDFIYPGTNIVVRSTAERFTYGA
jgi:hypothetical protein